MSALTDARDFIVEWDEDDDEDVSDLTAAGEPHTGAMIALVPSDADAARLAVADGEDADELHTTLYYLGDGADFSQESREHLVDLVSGYVSNLPPLTVDGFAVSVFNPPGSVWVDGKDRDACVVLGLSGDGLDRIHNAVLAAVEDYGADLPEQHSPWTPHVTLAYTEDADLTSFTDRTGSVTFDRVRLAFAGDVYDIPLEGTETGSKSESDGTETDPKSTDVVFDVELDETGVPVVPNALLDLRALQRERDVNAPGTPGHNLRNYWVRGPGAVKIGWGTSGSMRRCIAQLSKYVRDPGGLCAEYHRAATGEWPRGGTVPSVGDTVSADDTMLYGSPEDSGGDPVPWHIERNGEEFCVVKDADDTVEACHESRVDAVRQLRALYASEDEATLAAEVAHVSVADADGDCPPKHHRMPDGTCMPDSEMPEKVESYEMQSSIAGGVAPWAGVLTVEGVESGDGRMFNAGSLTWDTTPPDGLPLMWQKETSHGGQGDVSVRVGSITKVWREADPGGRANVNLVKGSGLIDLGNPDGAEAYRRMNQGFMSGNSVDVDSVKDADVELVYPETGDDADDGLTALFAAPQLTLYHKGRIRGSTLVEFPAFTEARLELVDAVTAAADVEETFGAVGPHDTATSDGSWDSGAQEKKLPSPLPLSTARRMFAWVDQTQVEDGAVPKSAGKLPHHEVSANGSPRAANLTACSAAIGALHGARGGVDVPFADRRAAYAHLAAHLRAGGQTPPAFDVVDGRAAALTAAVHVMTLTDTPPRAWFEEPTDVQPLGALTITDQGRVYGYLAPANVRHRSWPNAHKVAPLKRVDYARFTSGETIVADGGRVVTGPITMNCGHATVAYDLTAPEAQEHYDNACSVVASVAVGENKHGVWVAGALLPDVEPAQVQRAMTCKLSGDWRPHLDRPGWRELAAALLVPVPGFPMARVAPSVRLENGQLVASAVPVRLVHEVDRPTAEPEDRAPTALRATARRLAASLGRDPRSRVAALRDRVHTTATNEGE